MQEEVLLNLKYVFNETSYKSTMTKINTIENKLKNLSSSKIKIGANGGGTISAPSSTSNTTQKLLKQLKKPMDVFVSSIKKLSSFITGPLKSMMSGLLKLTSIFAGSLSIGGILQSNRATSKVLDEMNWQGAKSKTAFKYMNVAAQSNLIDESGVAGEIQELMKQQRQFKTTGTASDSNLQAMMSQFGLSLGDSIEDILTNLDKRRKVMGDTQYYTLMESIGKGNIARAQIEGSKMKNVPELYSMNRAENTAKITTSFNKMTASLKNDAFKVMEDAMPLIEKIFTGIAKLFKFLQPILSGIVNLVDAIMEKISNMPLVNKFTNWFSKKAEETTAWFANTAGNIRGGIQQGTTQQNNTTINNNYSVKDPSFAKNVINNVANNTNNNTFTQGLDMSFN